MPIDPFSILILFGVTIVLGYIGSLIFDKTKIPDVAWLLIFGLLVGPVFNFVDRSIFIEASPLLSSIALLAILFDAGLHIDFHKLIKEIPRGLVLSILGVSFSVIGVSLALMVILRFDFWGAIILSTIIGGTSSASVVGMISALRISDEAKMALQLESIFTDPIVIVVAITFMQFAIAKVPLATLVNSLASAYSIAIVLGFIIGVIWLYALDELKKRKFDYILTLAIVFLLYVLTETVGGSGPIAALIFGLVLGNGLIFSRFLGFKKRYKTSRLFKRFQEEIAFFIRSFFFVYLGLIASLDLIYLFYGALITAVIAFMRILSVQLSIFKMKLTETDLNIMRFVLPRGLAAAVLAQLPALYGIGKGDMFLNLSFNVILLTTLLTAIFIRISYKLSGQESVVKPEDTHRKK